MIPKIDWKNKQQRKAYNKAYHQTPERKAASKVQAQKPEREAYMKIYRKTPKRKAKQKAFFKKWCYNLENGYIKKLLRLKNPTPELIEQKRLQIKLKRKMYEIQRQINPS